MDHVLECHLRGRLQVVDQIAREISDELSDKIRGCSIYTATLFEGGLKVEDIILVIFDCELDDVIEKLRDYKYKLIRETESEPDDFKCYYKGRIR